MRFNSGSGKNYAGKNLKYLREWLGTYISEKEALTLRIKKMKVSYDERLVSINAKLKQYCTVMYSYAT